MVSFDIDSLLINVPIEFALKLLTPHFTPYIIDLFRRCLTNSYFKFNNQLYKQTHSSVCPAMGNFFMQVFEITALHCFPVRGRYHCYMAP